MNEEEEIKNREETEAETTSPKKKKKNKSFRRGVLTGILTTIAAMVLVIAIVFSVIYTQTGGLLTPGVIRKINVLSAVLDSSYYKDIKKSTKQQYLYKGLVESAQDEYTVYYTPKEYREFEISTTGNYAGIGAVLSQDKTTKEVHIVQVYENTPAEKAGLKAGDSIESAGKYKATDYSLDDFVQHLRGKENTTVTITYKRDGKENSVKVTREAIVVPSVESKMLTDTIGYINITEFSNDTQSEFEKALSELKGKGMKAVIFDVRTNGGGLVDSSTAILDDILPKGTTVYMKDKNGKRTNYTSDDAKQLDMPIVVLTSEYTASAAEIFTGAIRDFHYGTIIGTKTFGKGIVQNVLPFSDGSAIKVTIARYYTPSGECIHKKGISPDIKLKYQFLGTEGQTYDTSLDNQIQKAEEVLNQKLETK